MDLRLRSANAAQSQTSERIFGDPIYAWREPPFDALARWSLGYHD
jgi:hypothetical protein